MAPAPLPADPTLLTSPITDKVSSTILACSSRRILTPVAISAIEESQSQQNSSNDTTKCLQRKANKENETSFVQEVRRRYNRLSLNKTKRKNTVDLKRQHNTAEPDDDNIKRAKIDNSSNVETNTNIPKKNSCFTVPSSKSTDTMINGHNSKILENRYQSNITQNGSNQMHSNVSIASQQSNGNKISSIPPPIASLSNLGNTCFLNSVLYTLRFTPGFLHSLHHLANDLGLGNHGSNNGVGIKNRRGLIGLANNQGSSSSSNGCGTTGNSENDSETIRTLDVVDQLHDLFRHMSIFDETPETNREPIPPNNFLQAVGKLNPMFEGNQQQDAHELLVTVLNTLQDIKIPVPVLNNSAALDVIDHAPNNGKGHEMEYCNGNGKKGKQKKTGKSIFYPNNIHSSNSLVSNGYKTNKQDQTESQESKLNGATVHGSVSNETTLLPNFVKENFVGKLVMRTRCLECEASTYRSETFTNIDIPLTFDPNDCHISGSDQEGSDSQNDVKDLFLKQIMASETLRENNKYWCSECSRLNEAQRSVQYELLPQVMVLQLKRFTATGTKSSYMSKICDHIPTPFTMNCFCTQCLPTGSSPAPSSMNMQHTQGTAKHHYRLYAVIMHLGATLASGHYTSYVRAHDQAWEYLNCQRRNSSNKSQCNSAERIKSSKNGDKNISSGSSKGIMKYFSRSSSSSDTRNNIVNSMNSGGDTLNGHSANSYMDACKSSNCCGIRTTTQIVNGSEVGVSMKHQSSVASIPDIHMSEKLGATGPLHQRSLDGVDSIDHSHINGLNNDQGSIQSSDNGVSFLSSNASEELWLECDDETIHVISRKQFEEELKPNRGYTTPYLLFYQKVT